MKKFKLLPRVVIGLIFFFVLALASIVVSRVIKRGDTCISLFAAPGENTPLTVDVSSGMIIDGHRWQPTSTLPPIFTFLPREGSAAPDGQHTTYFRTTMRGKGQIFISQSGGYYLRLVRTFDHDFDSVRLLWSPDSKWFLIFRNNWGDGESPIEVIDASGQRSFQWKMPLPSRIDIVEGQHGWSADSKYVALTYVNNDKTQIVIAAVPDLSITASFALESDAQILDPQFGTFRFWSPSTHRFAILQEKPDGNHLIIGTAERGIESSLLLPNELWRQRARLKWSPNEKMIGVIALDSGYSAIDGRVGFIDVTHFRFVASVQATLFPRDGWFADDDRWVFERYTKGPETSATAAAKLYLFHINDNQIELLADNILGLIPNLGGQRVLIPREKNGRWSVQVFDFETNRQLTVVDDADQISGWPLGYPTTRLEWAPSGRAAVIVWQRASDLGENTFLTVLDVNTYKVHTIEIDPPPHSAYWLAQGRILLFATQQDADHSSIHVVNVETGEHSQLLQFQNTLFLSGAENDPRWLIPSPNLTDVALWFTDYQSHELLYIARLDGSNTKLVSTQYGTYDIHWSPNGTQLAHLSRQPSTLDVFSTDGRLMQSFSLPTPNYESGIIWSRCNSN